MSEDVEPNEEEPAKKSKLPLVIGVVLMLCGGGAGFYATFSGLLFAPEGKEPQVVAKSTSDKKDAPSFVSVDPIIVALSDRNNLRHLKFRAQLEVVAEYKEEVESMMPRVIDVFNIYLRALETPDIQKPEALHRIKSELLSRISIVLGDGRVTNLLIMEYVIS